MAERFRNAAQRMEENQFMSLVDEMMVPCHLMDKTTVNGGILGRQDTYAPGAAFDAAIVKDNTMQARIAEKQGVTELYTITTRKGFRLVFHDVIKRDSDGAIFRVTSNTVDSEAPERSTIKTGSVSAERWELPNDGNGNSPQ